MDDLGYEWGYVKIGILGETTLGSTRHWQELDVFSMLRQQCNVFCLAMYINYVYISICIYIYMYITSLAIHYIVNVNNIAV